MTQQALQYAKRRAVKKMLRAIPWLGSIVALATLGAAIRRKGALRGTADTALDFIPYVGGVKNTLEIARGRDFIRGKNDVPVRPIA